MRLKTALLIVFAAWLSAACGLVRHSAAPQSAGIKTPVSDSAEASGPLSEENPETELSDEPDPPPAMDVTEISSEREIRDLLMNAFDEWEGTPYLLGGSRKSGIDCSQLMNVIFAEYFGVDLPRTTRSQLSVGKSVRRSSIRTGDLIFFRTGRKTLHVGVAVNSGEFLHASTSNGVMISKLGNRYWRERYLMTRRVL